MQDDTQTGFELLFSGSSELFVVANGQATRMTWENVLDGKKHQSLRAVSYVALPRFLSKLLGCFDEATIVLGIDNMKALKRIDDVFTGKSVRFFKGLTEAVRDKVRKGSISLRYPSQSSPVHSKIYLMESEAGETRVILGSAIPAENALTDKGKDSTRSSSFSTTARSTTSTPGASIP